MWCLGAILWLASAEMCFPDGIPPEKRRNFTVYEYNGPLKIYKMMWASAQVATSIAKTVFEEVFGYHVDTSHHGWTVPDVVMEMAGCIKGREKHCLTEHDIRKPEAHIVFESWRHPAPAVPKENLPELYGVLDYMGEEGVYMLPGTANKYYATGRIVTVYSGFNGEVYDDFSDNFMVLRQLLAVDGWYKNATPGSDLKDVGELGRIVQMYTSSKRAPGDSMVDYEYATGDSPSDPSCYNIANNALSLIGTGCGTVWVAPYSRADPLGCVPIVTSTDWGYFLVQYAAKFGWPVCYMSVPWGEYLHLGRTYNILVYWWTPDTTFTSRNFVELRVPRYNGLAMSKGDHTTKKSTPLDVLAWKFVRDGDSGRGQFIAKFGSAVSWYDPDPAAWMRDVDGGMTNEQAACSWLKLNENRWRAWVPQMEPPCPIGQELDRASGQCQKCEAGSYASETNRERIIWDCVTCDPGRAQPNSGSAVCDQCEPGQYIGTPGATACKNCLPGYFQRADGQSSCSACAPGTFTTTPAQPVCEPCAIGFYQSEEARTGCVACPATFTTKYPGATSLSDCTCIEEFFWNRKDDVCVPCQPQGVCEGGLQPPTVWENNYGEYIGSPSSSEIVDKKAGTYRGTEEAFSKLRIYSCRQGQCVGEPGKCPEKRMGIACAICEPGYYLAGCLPCTGVQGSFVVLLILLVTCPLVFWAGSVICSKPYAAKATSAFQMASTFGIMAIFMQMLGMMSGFNLMWPGMFDALFSLGNIFLLDLEGLGVGCIVGNAFAPQYYTCFMLPVFIGAIMLALLPISRMVPSIRGYDTTVTLDSAVNFLGMLYSALYISLVKVVVAFFECVPNPAAPATLAKYKQVECYTPEHLAATPAMVLGMIFYVLGFYCICVYLNVTAPQRYTNVRFRNRSKFLINRWRVDVWYWGTVYMTRNLLLAMIAVISSTGVDQCIMMGLVMTFFLMSTAAYRPWKDARLQQFDNTISFIVVVAVSCGLGFMQLQSEKAAYARDTSDRAIRATIAIDQRMLWFGALLGLTLVVAASLFIALMVYCVWWMKHSKRLSEENATLQELVIERYSLIQKHGNFRKQFTRYIASATSHDMVSMCAFMDNMQARLGGSEHLGPMSSDLADALKAKTQMRVQEPELKIAVARVSFLEMSEDPVKTKLVRPIQDDPMSGQSG